MPSVADDQMAALIAAGYTTGTLADRQRAYLIGTKGYAGPTASIADMLRSLGLSTAKLPLLDLSGGGGGWTPASLTGLAGWWDADDASTFTYSSGSLVSQWRDKSGNLRHFEQGTVLKQPSRSGSINSKNAVLFDGVNTFMDNNPGFGLDVPLTILAVARNTFADAGQHELIIGKQGDGRVFHSVDGNISVNRGTNLSSGVPWGVTNAHSVAAVMNNNDSKIAVDSSAWTLGATGATALGNQGWRLGAYGQIEVEHWKGEVCEVVYVNAGISDAEKTSWFAYTASKWGTP